MRIRCTKPEFWRSERIASVSWEARLVLKGLESYVDDNGVGKDDVALIVGDVFPRDMLASPRETVARVTVALNELFNSGLIHRYEAEGSNLLYISWWEQTQRIDRPSKGRFRRPDGTLDYGASEIREGLARVTRALATGTGEQRNRGTVINTCASTDAERDNEPPTPTPIDTEFEQWYANYPRKRGRGQAVKAYRAARKKTDATTLTERLIAQLPTLTAKGPEYVPYPATWLNGERWEDQPDNVHQLHQPEPDGRIRLPPPPKNFWEQ